MFVDAEGRLCFNGLFAEWHDKESVMQIAKNAVASIEYVLKDAEGKIIDQSPEGQPLVYMHGTGVLVQGLEDALEGKSSGDEFTVTVPAAKAYGQRDENLVGKLPASEFSGMPLEVGSVYVIQTPAGRLPAMVKDISSDVVVVDANHPLAGKDLTFDIKIADVREADAEELAHGHAHHAGSCCCHGHHDEDGHGEHKCCHGHHHHDEDEHGEHKCCHGHHHHDEDEHGEHKCCGRHMH